MWRVIASQVLAASLVCSGSAPISSYPLAVKTPYLSAWLPGDQAHNVPTARLEFWAGQLLTWKVLARVNGETFSLFGCPDDNVATATQLGIAYTATHTFTTLQAPGSELRFTLDFFSPVSTVDFARQSIPFSYLTVSVDDATAGDEIAVMTAIDESWSAQPGKMVMEWKEGNHSQSFIIKNYHQTHASEDGSDMATWGRVVFSSDMSELLSYQSAAPDNILAQFSAHGYLSQDTGTYTQGHLVAFAHRLQAREANVSSSVTFAIGLQQDLNGFFGEEYETLYFEPLWPTTEELVDHFFEDEADAREESMELDHRVREIGEQFSANYADILEATVRQIWGSFHISIPWGNKDTSYCLGFMKALSAGGRVSTVSDLLPAALPVFYALAPDYIPLLLTPVLNMTLSWPEEYALHDIGKHYPNATGPTDPEDNAPVLQTSAILWMVYAYQKISENTKWIAPFLPTLQKYADYLVQHGLYPPPERSPANHAEIQANQTLLAMSAAIGLKAYGSLSGLANYSDIGDAYASKVLELGTDSQQTHFVSHLGDAEPSWSTAWPLAYDKLLGLNTFGESVFAMQSDWYESLVQPSGLQFSSETNFTVAELEMLAAASSSESVRALIVDSLHLTTTSRIEAVPGPNRWTVLGDGAGKRSLTKAQASIGGYWMMAAVDMSRNKDSYRGAVKESWFGQSSYQIPLGAVGNVA